MILTFFITNFQSTLYIFTDYALPMTSKMDDYGFRKILFPTRGGAQNLTPISDVTHLQNGFVYYPMPHYGLGCGISTLVMAPINFW